jgi:putative Mg2+ transporter-C (MgtC) family protein
VEAKFERDLERKLMFIEFQMKRGKKVTSPELLAKLSELQGVKRVSVD